MDIKNIIRRTMAFVAIVAISAAAAMAQTVALKQDTNGKWGIAYTDGRGNWGKWAVKAEYTVIEPFEEGYYLAQKDGSGVYYVRMGKRSWTASTPATCFRLLAIFLHKRSANPTSGLCWIDLPTVRNGKKHISRMCR